MKRCFLSLRGALLVSLVFGSVKANSADFFLNFTNTFSGTPPAGSPPPTTMFFQDNVPGSIYLTISNVGLIGTEFVTELDFNLNTSLNPTSLLFTHVGGSGGFTLPVITTGVDFQKADGDGFYDIEFAFDSTAGGRFTVGDYVTYQISGIAGLTANDFAFLSKPANGGGAGPFYAGAHVQSIGGGDSGWVSATSITLLPIPEPAAGTFFAAAALCIAGRLFFRRATRQSVEVLKC